VPCGGEKGDCESHRGENWSKEKKGSESSDARKQNCQKGGKQLVQERNRSKRKTGSRDQDAGLAESNLKKLVSSTCGVTWLSTLPALKKLKDVNEKKTVFERSCKSEITKQECPAGRKKKKTSGEKGKKNS